MITPIKEMDDQHVVRLYKAIQKKIAALDPQLDVSLLKRKQSKRDEALWGTISYWLTLRNEVQEELLSRNLNIPGDFIQ